MSKPDDGGQAFPTASPQPYEDADGADRFTYGDSGMTLRDYFAAQALQSAWDACDKGYFDGAADDIATCAYQLADAMLKARQS